MFIQFCVPCNKSNYKIYEINSLSKAGANMSQQLNLSKDIK